MISGSGGVNQIGAGTLVLSGANTYSGGTNIEHGTLSVGSDGNLGTGGPIAMSAGSTLKVTATGAFGHAVTLTGDPTFNIAPATTTTWNGVIGDGASAGTLEVSGGGTLVLTAANTYSGGTTIHGGSILSIASDGNLGGASGSLTLGDATTAGTLEASSGLTLSSTRSVSLGAGGGTIISDTSFEIDQGITGGGGLTTSRAGTLILAGANTYSGGTTISAGTLQLGNGSTTGSLSGDVTDNGTLAFDRSDTITFGGVISGSGGVNQIGAGTLVLSGANTYSGGTNIEHGTLSVGSDGNLGTGGTIAMSGFDSKVTATGAFGHAVTLTGDPTFNIAPATTTTWNGVIADGASAGTLEVSGGGTLVLTATNTYSGGTTVHGGSKLSIASDANLGGASGSLALGDASTSGTLEVTSNLTLSSTRSVSLGAGGGTIISDGTSEIDQGITGGGGLTSSGAGTLILAGANTYSGGTTISAGTLQLGNGSTTGSLSGDVTDNGTLAFDRSDTLTFGGAISGSGALNQIGAGTLILTAANTYTGLTTVTTARAGGGRRAPRPGPG